MKEIKRLQKLAGIKEIVVNNPLYPYFNKWKEDIIEHLRKVENGYEGYLVDINIFREIKNPEEAIEYLISMEYLEDNDDDIDNSINFIKYGHYIDDVNEVKINNPIKWEDKFMECWYEALDELGYTDLDDDENTDEEEDETSTLARQIFYKKYKRHWDDININEDISGFKKGDVSDMGYNKSIVTGVDHETQSVSWDIKKDIDDDDIYKDISGLIKKLERIGLKDFHSRPKLIQLIKDLKTIRNRFSRTVIKEDKVKLLSILNEIKLL